LINSKLINILRTFSKNEMKEFEKLVLSPFFNGGRNYHPFLKELNKFYPKFDDKKMTPEYIHSKLYPGKKFNRQIIWNMTSGLLNMAGEFLMHTAVKKNRFIRNNLVSGEYRVRKLERMYLKAIEEMEKNLDRPGISHNYFQSKIQLESARKEYYYLEEKQLMTSKHSIKEGEYSVLYFLWNMVGTINDMKVYSYMFNTSFDINIPLAFINNLNLKKLIDYCKAKNFSYSWFMEMCYCQIMMTIESDGWKYFYRLKELFEQNYKNFIDEDKLNWITCIINYCGYRNDSESRKILFDIHKFELKEGLAFTGKYLSKPHFLQILKNAISINEMAWVKNFIDEYVPKLKPSYQNPILYLSMAYYYFNLKDYNKVIDNLNKSKFPDAKDKLAVKLIYIRTYYELNEIEVLFSHIDSALHFISNNISVIREDIAENYRGFLKLLRKLIIAKDNNDGVEIGKIRKEAVKKDDLLLGEWLIEKIDEYSGRT